MDSNLLSLYYVFSVVASSKSISAASEELYVSQPAVSKNIKKLENLLNTTLLVRSPHGISLTMEGQELYNHLTKAFDTIALGENTLKHINNLGIGHISIGVSSTLCKYLLLPKISTFIKKYPHIQISIKSQSSADTLKALKSGDIDFGIVAGNTERFESIPLDQLTDVFVATPEYVSNLIARDNINESMILNNANLILLNKDNITRQYIEQYLNKWKISTTNAIELNSMELIIDFAKTGLGVAATIKRFVETELNNNELVLINTPGSIKKREVTIVYPHASTLSDTAKKLIYHITEQNKAPISL